MIINIINMVENFDNHKKVDEQNRKIVLQLEADVYKRQVLCIAGDLE